MVMRRYVRGGKKDAEVRKNAALHQVKHVPLSAAIEADRDCHMLQLDVPGGAVFSLLRSLQINLLEQNRNAREASAEGYSSVDAQVALEFVSVKMLAMQLQQRFADELNFECDCHSLHGGAMQCVHRLMRRDIEPHILILEAIKSSWPCMLGLFVPDGVTFIRAPAAPMIDQDWFFGQPYFVANFAGISKAIDKVTHAWSPFTHDSSPHSIWRTVCSQHEQSAARVKADARMQFSFDLADTTRVRCGFCRSELRRAKMSGQPMYLSEPKSKEG